MKLAEDALNLIPSSSYWTKGTEEVGTQQGSAVVVQRCLFGALSTAFRQSRLRITSFEEALDEAIEVIREQFPERYYPTSDGRPSRWLIITSFNDDRNTTYLDVRTVLEKLAAH